MSLVTEIDVNFKDSQNPYNGYRDTLIKNTHKSWAIDESFPDNWDDLVQLIFPTIKENLSYLDEVLSTNSPETLPTNNVSDSNRELFSTIVYPPLNQILYGPPGTGKTYHTVDKALEIVDPEFLRANYNNREELTKHFRKLLITDFDGTNGQIAFTTFHQSFCYEDFVEGIKPRIVEGAEKSTGEIEYEISDGIFKKIVRLSEDRKIVREAKEGNLVSFSEKEFDNAEFYKLSLGDSTKEEDAEIYDYCIENSLIAIGFIEGVDLTGFSEDDIKALYKDEDRAVFDPVALNYFIHYIKDGDYVLVSKGNRYARALAKVVGGYEYRADSPIRYNHFRKVEWIFKNIEIPIKDLYESLFSQKTIYKMEHSKLKKEFFVNTDKKRLEKDEEKNYVLIIDEINRGNVSSIFGELITQIEDNKRAGRPEELEVILPYSKKSFKVPRNIYIIGTMNTADRSIEALDTALRRRFSFIEMPPQPELIRDLTGSDGVIGNLDIVELLGVINDRIEVLIDKDHKIGHSYFIGISTETELKSVFKNKVIPLLEEYFFGDFGKIGLVLGDSFVGRQERNDVTFAQFEDSDKYIDYQEKEIYYIKDNEDWVFEDILKS